jgi:serpin B
MERRIAFLAGIAAIVVLLIGGGTIWYLVQDESGENNNVKRKPSDWTGELLDDTNATAEGVEDIVSANNQFAIDLFLKISEDDDGNMMICPYSVFSALSMTYEGAKGQTATEMADILHLPEDDVERRGSFASIQNDINMGSDEYELATANKIWPHSAKPVVEEFIETIQQFYYGGVETLDYTNDPDGCQEIINSWIANQTNDKITDLIPDGILNSYTYMVLTNAVYFKGTWVYQFDKDDTKDTNFRNFDGEDVQVPMMNMLLEEEDMLPYYENEDLQAVELPYEGDDLSMVVLLPKSGSIIELEDDLDSKMVTEIRNGMEETNIEIYLPKFKMKEKYTLNQPLISLGMEDAFTPGADFSGMDPRGLAYIAYVLHDTFIEVNEEGTEAAGATAVVMYDSAVSYPTFNANQPFIYMIQQKSTGNILFLGRVTDPSLEE